MTKNQEHGQCPLCKKNLGKDIVEVDNTTSFVCISCGNVVVHSSFIPECYGSVLHILSGWTRERTERNEKPIPILSDDAPPNTEGIAVQAILKLPSIPSTIGHQIIKLLSAIQRKSKYFGEEINLSSARDYTLAYLEHFTETNLYRPPFHKLMQQVIELGWVKSAMSQSSLYELTVKGIGEIEKASQVTPESVDCFIAMKFGDDLLDKAFKQAISPAINDTGHRPVQMAYLEHNNTIMDEMIACIKKSRFMVADLTYQNQNVYFEAGFAQGMGIPVIYTCHEDSVDNIMFDTQHSNQIRWIKFDELRIKLRNRILATIG
ncbi:MAG: hypothetical protein KAR45_12685 [Desulfobacteraceae bacterium]|nr:hypothetical protein [Desulfobacteraceae bacterium]